MKLHQVRISILFVCHAVYVLQCSCLWEVICTQSLTCVAVNEVFGNRERLVLAGANSAALSSLASSSSNNSETAMES